MNTLLDFSRIEAGRYDAAFEPVELGPVTADLASVFRSAAERAGLRLIVDCPPLGEPVHVDRDMWEKIVLNLLSNAFKFTFEGSVEVTLRRRDDAAVLSVTDTGTGIEPEELPHLFERFRQVKGARARSFEGSGIGLALVRELVALHGGDVRVESEPGEGTAFTVSLPLGVDHLPADRIVAPRGAVGTGGEAYVAEALGWLTGEAAESAAMDRPAPVGGPDGPRPKILVVDDNADMREYLRRLLGRPYEVEAVADGEAALRAVRRHQHDLVLSDVMMPGLDGLGLLSALRSDESTRSLPVILLSARAGEEARVEGIEAGADDYVVKPFSARELLARVESHLRLQRLRRRATAELRESEKRFRSMADSAPVMVWVTDRDGSCTYLSRSWYEFTGQTPETGLGFGWLDVVHPEDQGRSEEIFLAANERREPFRLEYRIRRHDGVYRWAIDSAAVHADSTGEFQGYIGSVIDITDRKETEEALREADRRKDEFLALLAHELRNPLAPIRNAAQVLS